MSPKDLSAYNITESNSVKLEFEGNITVEGEIITGSSYKEKLSLSVLKLYRNTWRQFVPTGVGRL
jgi:hypothetical protein